MLAKIILRVGINFYFLWKLNMQNTIKIEDIAQRLNFSIENSYKILEIFYESSNKILDNLEESITLNDFDKIYRNAHSIKGSSSNLLFNEVYEIAKEIETFSKSNNAEYPYTDRVKEIRNILENTRVE